MNPSSHIREVTNKKWRNFNLQYDNIYLNNSEDDSSHIKHRGRNSRPIIWVPLEEKLMCGWKCSLELKPGYHKHEGILNLILNYYNDRISTIKSEKLIRTIRSKNHIFHLLRNDIEVHYHKKLRWEYIYSYHDTMLNFLHCGFPEYLREKIKSGLNEWQKIVFDNFFEKLGTFPKEEYMLKTGYGNQNSFIPIDLLKIKIRKQYVSEIGLLDSEWERNHDFLYYKINFDSSLDKGRPTGWWNYHANKYERKHLNKTSKANYKMGLKEFIKLEDFNSETSETEILRKVYKNRNIKDKCL